jgi:hypothetical protein
MQPRPVTPCCATIHGQRPNPVDEQPLRTSTHMHESTNPLEAYILEQIDHFAEESKRLHDVTPLQEYKAITDAFETIQTTLGTLEHEVALDAAKRQFRIARSDSIDALKEAWTDFWRLRRLASQSKSREAVYEKTGAEHLQHLEESLRDLKEKDSPLYESMARAVEAVRKYRHRHWLFVYLAKDVLGLAPRKHQGVVRLRPVRLAQSSCAGHLSCIHTSAAHLGTRNRILPCLESTCRAVVLTARSVPLDRSGPNPPCLHLQEVLPGQKVEKGPNEA